MNVEALNQLKRVLQESIANKIMIGGMPIRFNMNSFIETSRCGTSACAAGSAGLDPWFIERGFATYRGDGTVNFKTRENFEACKEFFQISCDQALYLFDPCAYDDYDDNDDNDYMEDSKITEQNVIERIDELLAKHVTQE